MAEKNQTMKLPKTISQKLKLLLGQKCTFCRVESDKSLFLGFGETHFSKRTGTPHGEWEIGTYDGGWRFVRPGMLVCSRYDLGSTCTELNVCVNTIHLGYLKEVSNVSEFDVRFTFSCGTCIDFLTTISDDNEVVHIFIPDKEIVVYTAEYGWQIGRSDLPWNPYPIEPSPPDDQST
jgi:hypothetical protein